MSSKIAWVALVGMSLVSSGAFADNSKTDPPGKTTPFREWTASQQWLPDRNARHDYGYYPKSGTLLLADEFGDKLSEQGRATMVMTCFQGQKADVNASMAWMLCGADVKVLDLQKLAAELDADGADAALKAQRIKDATETLEKAKKIGEVVEAAAQKDAGLKQLLKLGNDAKVEWSAYISKHQADFDRYVALKDGVRTHKTNDVAFEGCYEATMPSFSKLVKATAPKIPFDVGEPQLLNYTAWLIDTMEGYITTAAWAACAWSIDPSGESPYTAAVNQVPIVLRAGRRTLALSKALEPELKIKFADRSIDLESFRRPWGELKVHMAGTSDFAGMANASGGVIGATKANGDSTKITFKSGQEQVCLEWRDTKRVQAVTNGNVSYEKVCAKRGMHQYTGGETDVPTKILAKTGKIGDNLSVSNHFPTATWKGLKVTSIFGVPLP